MQVLSSTQKLLKFTGLKFKDEEPIWYRIYRVLCLMALSSMLQPQISYFIVNLQDLFKATDVFVQISAEIMSIIKVIVFLLNWRIAKSLLCSMQTDFEQTTFTNFEVANKEGLLVTKINNALMIYAGIFHSGGPIAIMLYNYVRGTMRPELIVHPFKGVFLFDYQSLPGYIFGYLLNIMYNVYVASYFSAMDTFYVGICLFGCAHLEDVQCTIQTSKSAMSGKDVNEHLAIVIKRHYAALEYISRVQAMMSGIILTQFLGVTCVLSTLAFQIIIITDGTVLMYIAPCAAVVVELFLFCYYGNKLTTKSFEVLEAIYQSNWYEYPIQNQRYVALIMARMQRPLVLTGYDVVTCNLPTFTSVLRAVGSVIAVFQSME